MPTPTQAPAQGGEIEPDWSFPAFVADDAAPQFTKPEGWRPEVHNTQSSPVYDHAYAEPAFQPEPAFAYPVDSNGLFNPGASFSMSSSGAPSPRMGPYTPNMVSRPLDGEAPMPLDIHSGANMWTAASLQSQPWDQQANAWAWSAPGAMFDDHFELSMIPPVALDVPKFELDQQSKYDSSAVDPAMLHAPSSYGQEEQQHQWTEGNTWGYGYEGYDSGLAA
ncbi:hypothetical protein PENSPDRAFT_48919 [Peniophora sp. CONT]|nr:hypothetical protein PENSPDRAFT_48919 [Peniophora sp. CONT]